MLSDGSPWIYQWLRSCGSNFGIVNPGPNALVRGAHPGGRLAGYQKTFGLKAILDLRLETLLHPDQLLPEKDDAIKLGLEYYNIPMTDRGDPDPVRVYQALDLIDQKRPMMVYCQGGRHRTGLVIACYRVISQHWTKERAWDEAIKYGWYDHGGRAPMREWFEGRHEEK